MQKDILFNYQLSDRDFGSYLLHVPSLLEWTESKGIHFPETNPQINTYKFVQAEELLCAIERVFRSLTTEQAFNIVQSYPELRDEKAAREPDTARWLLGADAHLKWRKRIVAAVKTGELKLLDFASKFPLSPQAATELLECLRDDNQSNTRATNSNDDDQIGEIVQAGDNTKGDSTKGWHEDARSIAGDFHLRDTASGARSSIADMADRVAEELRLRGIAHVKGNTVKREALQGGRWVRPVPKDKKGTEETGGIEGA